MFSRIAAALTAVLLFSLTACGGSDEPQTQTETETGSVPEYADNEGRAGAEQFIGFWVDTLNEATTSGETEELKALGAPDCQTCSDFATQLDQIYADGGRVESEGWEVGEIVPEAGGTDDEVGLLVTFKVSPQTLYASEDAEPQEFEGGDQAFRFQLLRDGGEWQVENLSAR